MWKKKPLPEIAMSVADSVVCNRPCAPINWLALARTPPEEKLPASVVEARIVANCASLDLYPVVFTFEMLFEMIPSAWLFADRPDTPVKSAP